MELNLLLGGPERPEGLPRRCTACRTTPRSARCAARSNAPHDAARRLHHRAQPRAVREDRRLPARRRAAARDRQRLDRRAAHRPGRARRSRPPAATSIRRCSSGSAPGIMPLSVEEGIANGVPEVRTCVRYQIKHGAQADQDLRVGRRDVAQHRAGRAAVLRRGVRGDRRRGAPRRHPGRRARARRRRRSGPASGPASTASSTASSPATTPSR